MLNNKEWLRINDIILLIHSAENLAAVRSYFLDAVKPLVLYEKAMFYLFNENTGNLAIEDPVFANADLEFLKKYEHLFRNWRYGRVAVNSRRTIAFRDSDLIPEAHINADEYRTFLLARRLPYGGGIIITDSGKLLAEVALFRTEQQGNFGDKEIYILDILKQHLQIRFVREGKGAKPAGREGYQIVKLLEAGLTKREIEVSELVAAGLTNCEIAERLNISIYTAKRHLNNIFAKLEMNSRFQLKEFIEKL